MKGSRLIILSLLLLVTLQTKSQMCRIFTPENGLTSSLVNHIYEDRYGQIWIASEEGLNRYDGVKITTYKHRDGDKTSLASNYVSTMIEDAHGRLIVSTYAGLQIYRHDTDDFSPTAVYCDGRTMKANISNLRLLKGGRLYGTGDVSCEIVAKGRERLEVRRLAKAPFADPLWEELPQDLNARSMLRWDNRHLLLGTDGDGVKLYDVTTKRWTDYVLDIPGVAQKLQKVHHMIRDRRGNLWLALYQKGVVMMSGCKNMFGYIGAKSAKNDLIGSHCVTSMCRSKKGGMWIGTDGDGLYHLQRGKSTHYVKGVAQMVNAIVEDSEGTLWVGSYGEQCYKGKDGKFCKVEGLPAVPRVFCLAEDQNRNMWLGTMGNGLYKCDLKRQTMEKVSLKGMNRYVNCVYVKSDGTVLAGTFNGVYNMATQEHICPKRIVYAIHEDGKGRLWLGSSDGLVKIDHGRQTVYSSLHGMPSNTVFAISEDENGRVWFSSNSGLSCFDELEGVFTNYSVRDGLQGNEFSKGAVMKDNDGTLWFAGHDGVTYFTSSHVIQSQYTLHPRITALYVNNEPVNTRTMTGGVAVMDEAIFDSRHFTIAYENNSFSIELATKEIDSPAECTYCYSLDGGNWTSIPDGGHVVTFSNMDAGKHTFCYAVEYNGKRSQTEEVVIEIRHPWWGSPWAKGVAGMFLVGMAALMFFWIRSREKVKALALISHKIRTPMTLIINPLTQLIESDSDEERQKSYRLMLRNANKLQHLAAQATEEEPIGPIESVEAEVADDARLQQSRTTRQLLIVEDDDDVRRYLCEQLSADFHVREATNGKEALELIFKKMPDAIISDVTMPQMDGITLCKKLKKNIKLAHIPVILLTARADEESTLQGLGIGADAYITKPFNIKILRQNISNLILLRQQLRNTYQDQLLQEDKQKAVEAVDYDDQFMARLMNCINKHIGEKDFSIEMLCEEVGISRAQLHRRLKEKTNQSTSIFIRNVRLNQAARLLVESDMRVSEVADKVGFAQTTYFCNAFKDLYGVSPTEYRIG